jgi:hypothetical protein
MQPIFGFLLFFVALVIVAVVANKRGRSGVVYFLVCAVVGFLLVILISRSGGSGVAAGFGAFLAPVGGIFFALASSSSEQLAVERGAHGDYKKCPYCAEPVRREAVKCKHCGSTLEPEGAGDSAGGQRP